MENPSGAGLRSRSRSKTPFLRSSCDQENCAEVEEHTHRKSGRKTPIKRSTPVKQLNQGSSKSAAEPITEEEEHVSPPAHRTRLSTRTTDKAVKTSDYSSEESLDRLRGSRKEILQNELNSQYERVSTSTSQRSHYSTLADVTLSPIHGGHNVTHDRSLRFGSPAYSGISGCSTDSSFAEQALADVSVLLERDRTPEHLPYKLYKMAGEYWNKYPKTDYTYSRLSKDRVELAPGQVAVPNMSRRSLAQFRVQGPLTSAEELRRAYSETHTSKRFTSLDSSDDESYITGRNGGHLKAGQRYSYSRPALAGLSSRVAAAAATPFVWIYTIIKKVVTTTITTVTETITPNHVEERSSARYVGRSYQTEAKRRWWPWLLLLLLPLLGYGCYNYADTMQSQPADTYKSPVILQDADLSKRMEALETWAINVDGRLKNFNEKLSKLDNLEAKIEHYSLKHLQNNLIQIFNMADNSGTIALKLKEYFDQHYMTKDQVQTLSIEIHEKLMSSWKPDLDEDRIRKLIQEYLLVFEKRQVTLILERVKETVREVETGFDLAALKKIVAEMITVYDADKTGLVDYALESAGGQVLSTKCTELYQIKTKQYSILGLPVWWVYTSPRNALTPGAMPAECWAFQGFPGYLVIRLYAIVEVTGFSVEHMSRLLAADGKIESAPKNFSVYGLHGENDPEPHLFGDYMYDANGTAIQYFPVQHPKMTDVGGVQYPVAYDIIELRVESNYGNPTYTCLYRFRVHGNPLSDIRQATQDSIRDSEF